MSEFMFGFGRGHVLDSICIKADRIASKHDCSFTQIKDPGNGWIHWFAGPNLGHPFDESMAKEVYLDLRRAGITGFGIEGEEYR